MALLASCAVAGSDQENEQLSNPDASIAASFPDAGPSFDAAPRPDAAPPAADATSISSADASLFCDSSDQCGTGTCCFSVGGPGFCVAGSEVFGVCLPD